VNAIAQRTFAALQFRNYRLYVASQLVSFSGTWMQALAQSWLVLELTGSGTALGTLLAFQFLPTLFLAPLGGLLADRFDKRRVLIGTQTFAGLLALTLGALTMSGAVELWMVYLIAVGFGVNTALDNPTRQVFVMEMVGREHITNAVTLNSVTVNAARAVGPAIGGVLIATLGIAECFIVNGFSYLAVIAALILIDRSQLHPTPLIPRESGQLRQGLRYAWSAPTLRTTLVILAMVGLFLFEFNVTLPLLADHTFNVGASGLAVMETLFGVGAVLGGLAVASAGPPTARRLVFVCAASGASVLALAIAPDVAIAYAVVPLVGAFSIATIAVGNATLQLNAAPHLRGRVMALFSVAVMGTTPIGGPIVGWIGEHVDPRVAVALGGLAGLAAAAFGWFQVAHKRVFPTTRALVGAPAAGQ
jgi:MFS family permease